VVNKDWEEISQDSTYFYIGDFGNNVSEKQKRPSYLRIEKRSLALDVPKIDTLSFSYSDQTDFRKSKPALTVKLLSLLMTVFICLRNSGNKKEQLLKRRTKPEDTI
jgi:hypothetical protein